MAIRGKGTTVEIRTGTGIRRRIGSITRGAVTEIGVPAHHVRVGDVVTFADIGGTTELNGTTAVVIAVETSSFVIGVDSSAYGAYTTGGAVTLEEYVEIGELVDFEGPEGEAHAVQTTSLGDTAHGRLMGVPDWGKLTLTCALVPDDKGQRSAELASALRQQRTFRITYSDGTVQRFRGYVLGTSRSGGTDERVGYTVAIGIASEIETNPRDLVLGWFWVLDEGEIGGPAYEETGELGVGSFSTSDDGTIGTTTYDEDAESSVGTFEVYDDGIPE